MFWGGGGCVRHPAPLGLGFRLTTGLAFFVGFFTHSVSPLMVTRPPLLTQLESCAKGVFTRYVDVLT